MVLLLVGACKCAQIICVGFVYCEEFLLHGLSYGSPLGFCEFLSYVKCLRAALAYVAAVDGCCHSCMYYCETNLNGVHVTDKL